jgi:hypothetical protein
MPARIISGSIPGASTLLRTLRELRRVNSVLSRLPGDGAVHYTYVLESLRDPNTRYIGHTSDLRRRVVPDFKTGAIGIAQASGTAGLLEELIEGLNTTVLVHSAGRFEGKLI